MSALLLPQQPPRPRFAHLLLEPRRLGLEHRAAETREPVVPPRQAVRAGGLTADLVDDLLVEQPRQRAVERAGMDAR